MIMIAGLHSEPSQTCRRIFAKNPICGARMGSEYASGLWCDNVVNVEFPFFPWENGTFLKTVVDRWKG